MLLRIGSQTLTGNFSYNFHVKLYSVSKHLSAAKVNIFFLICKKKTIIFLSFSIFFVPLHHLLSLVRDDGLGDPSDLKVGYQMMNCLRPHRSAR